MSQVEKRGIAGAYKKGCGCEVSISCEKYSENSFTEKLTFNLRLTFA